jgi:hypothetical protein
VDTTVFIVQDAHANDEGNVPGADHTFQTYAGSGSVLEGTGLAALGLGLSMVLVGDD